VSLLAIIDYSLVLIFFIGLTALLLLFTRSSQQAVASAPLPSPREEPTPYVFLAVLFLLLILLTVFTQKRRGQSNAFG
jgi:preprotein translocase subunit SecG